MSNRAYRAAIGIAVAMSMMTAPAIASEAALSTQILKQEGWVAYEVPIVAHAGAPCCYEMHSAGAVRVGCDLNGHGWSSGSSDGEPVRVDDSLAVYLHVHDARVDKVRAFGASCPVRDAETIRRIDAVSGADSVAWLAQAIAGDHGADETASAELAALAWHADASATATLQTFGGAAQPRKLRREALLWSGELRGKSGAEFVERVALTDADADMRTHAVFVLTQSPAIDGYATIHRISQNDESEHVREQALFWMAHTADARARNDILAAIDKDASPHVREQAVFALTQLKNPDADAALIQVARGDHPRKVKERALFWLGRSGSDAALRFIDEVLSAKADAGRGT